MLILVNFVPLLVAMKCRDLVQSNRWIKLVLLPSNKRIHDTSICFLPRYEKVAWCHSGWIVGCTKISNNFQISILPWYMLYIYERRPKRGNFGIFRCPKMGLWVPESKIWDPFFTPTSPQHGGIGVCFYPFATFGHVIGKFWILNIMSSFLSVKRSFYKISQNGGQARKTPQNHYFCTFGPVSYKYNICISSENRILKPFWYFGAQ